LLARKEDGRLRQLYTEGWPHEQRSGRKIGLQRVRLAVQGGVLHVWENDSLPFEGTGPVSEQLSRAYLYLQMSSHSNYPAREVYFDNIQVSSARPE
jgi:hypothetical protein